MTRHLAAAAFLIAFLTSCGGGTEPGGIEVGTIVVAPNPIVVMQQQTAQLAISVLDPSGALLAGVPVTFTSGDPSVVTVSNVGLVTSVGPAGQTSVSVKAGNKSQAVPVTVTATSNSIVLGPQESQLPQLGTMQLEPVLLDLAGNPVAGAEFTYETTNAQIATVDVNGLLTSHGKAGLVTITARSGAISGVKAVAVTPVPTSVALTPDPVTVVGGGSVQLSAKVLDVVDDPIAGASISFSASPAALLTVSTNGLLAAADQEGSGTVTATSGTLSYSAAVSVVDVGSLEGVLLPHISTGGTPYGVAIASNGTIHGVGVNGTYYRGTLGSSTMDAFPLTEVVTIGIAVNAAGNKVYVTGAAPDGLMELDGATGSRLRTWNPPGDDQLYDVVLSPDGQTLYTAGSFGTIYSISVSTFAAGPEYISTGPIVHLLHHPAQSLIYASGVGSAKEVNTETHGERIFTVDGSAQAAALAISGDKLYVAGEGGTIDVVTLSTGSSARTAIACGMYDLVATPDGQGLVATCTSGGFVLLIDAQTLAAVKTITTSGDPRRAALSADGTRLVVANYAGWFDIIQ